MTLTGSRESSFDMKLDSSFHLNFVDQNPEVRPFEDHHFVLKFKDV
jgi:hypothetical protein